MSETTIVHCTIDTEDVEKIDKMLECLNAKKAGWQRKSNRQSVIRCLVKWAVKQDLVLDSRYSKEVYVVKTSESIQNKLEDRLVGGL